MDFHFNTVPLNKKYKSNAYDLFKNEWIEKPDCDFSTSWNGRDESSVAILDENNKFIGFIISSYHRKNGDNLYIDYIALNDDNKGKGIGSKILKQYISNAFAKKSSVHLWPDSDDILPWYTRHGFSPTNDGYYNFHSYETRRQDKIHKGLGLC